MEKIIEMSVKANIGGEDNIYVIEADAKKFFENDSSLMGHAIEWLENYASNNYCSCTLSESQNHCDCDCGDFDYDVELIDIAIKDK